MDTPRVTCIEVPVTKADRDAMLHKHPIETELKEVARQQVGPGLTLVAKRQMMEVYRHEFDGVVKFYDIRAIKNLIHNGMIPVKALRLELNDAYVDHIYNLGGCEQQRLDAITEQDIERPGIGIFYPDGVQIVDGSHRIVARWRRFNKRFARLLITPGEIEALFLINPRELDQTPWGG